MKWYQWVGVTAALAGSIAFWRYSTMPEEQKEKQEEPKVKLQGFSVTQHEVRAKYVFDGTRYLIVDRNKDGSIDEFFADEKPASVTSKHQSIYDKMLKENIIVK